MPLYFKVKRTKFFCDHFKIHKNHRKLASRRQMTCFTTTGDSNMTATNFSIFSHNQTSLLDPSISSSAPLASVTDLPGIFFLFYIFIIFQFAIVQHPRLLPLRLIRSYHFNWDSILKFGQIFPFVNCFDRKQPLVEMYTNTNRRKNKRRTQLYILGKI